jgi:hypothetical protein
VHRLDRPRPPEQFLQLGFTDFVRQVADVQLSTHMCPSSQSDLFEGRDGRSLDLVS